MIGLTGLLPMAAGQRNLGEGILQMNETKSCIAFIRVSGSFLCTPYTPR